MRWRTMQRREFVALLGGAAAAWPLAARAQQPERMRRVGVLMNIPADDQQTQLYLAAFQQGLQELGWTVGRNLRIDHRWGPSNDERIRQQATELLALTPDVMLWAGGGQVIRGRVGRSKGAAEIWRFGTRSAAARAADVRRLRSLSQG